MRRRDWLIVMVALALVGAAAWVLLVTMVPPPTPQAAAKTTAEAYFAYLRDSKVERARALAEFEEEKAEAEWTRQVQDYVERRKKGAQMWWGDPFAAKKVPGPAPGEWALVEVEWRYKLGLGGWMRGDHFPYRMHTVDGEWRMVIDNRTTEWGIPWVPAGM